MTRAPPTTNQLCRGTGENNSKFTITLIKPKTIHKKQASGQEYNKRKKL
jgi:hypothetical protein